MAQKTPAELRVMLRKWLLELNRDYSLIDTSMVALDHDLLITIIVEERPIRGMRKASGRRGVSEA